MLSHHRPRCRRALLCLLALVAGGLALRVPPAAAATAPPWFGTLVTDPAHAQAESDAGVKVGMLELSWERYEPARGQFDAGYGAEMRARLLGLQAAGMRVTLALGLHRPPAWAFTLPDSRFVDQDGHVADQVDLVFNQVLRAEVDRYFAQVAADLHPSDLWAVRLTSGGDAEMLYPGGGYWAFDANAQNGPDMPPTMARNPFPGWRPGSSALTTDQVTQWADWYVRALADTAAWQMRSLAGLGFRGYYQVLTPGSGVRPGGFVDAVAHHLPNGLLGVGAVWDRFYAFLPDRRNVVAYVSSMADLSGGDDSCQPGDSAVALDSPTADSWSATRWISRIANQWALPKAGENPGYDAPSSLNAHYLDASPAGMLPASFRQLTSCGFQGMYWAHDDRLWDGTMALARYTSAIAQVAPAGAPAPPFPGAAVLPHFTSLSIDDVATGAGANTMSFTGAWSHCGPCGNGGLYGGTTTWSATAGDTVQVSFTGTQVSLYGELDPGHGKAAVRVDASSWASLDYYAAVRVEGRRIWRSPVLPYGPHVLTLQVKGTHRAASTGSTVPVDRVVVTLPAS